MASRGLMRIMRLPFLICLTLIAFASNSILNRMAVGSGAIDASSFAVIRTAAGAVMLAALARGRMQFAGLGRAVGALSLAIYMIGFSLAYRSLDAGLGALILFGTVQIGMFSWGAMRGNTATVPQMLGAGIAFAGLIIALWPGAGAAIGVVDSGLMVLAGLGWAAYTLNGRGSADPLADTGANFVICLPLVIGLLFLVDLTASAWGVVLAIVCGAVTSGLGYACWYTVLPQIRAQTAAVLQLSVPIIAILAGALLLGEVLTLKLALAAALVLSGIVLTIRSGSARADRK